MKTVFLKSHLPFLKNTLHKGSGRDLWKLSRIMQESNGVQHQLPVELALLEKGVHLGDAWSMCELARTLFKCGGDLFLPKALRLWRDAATQKDAGTLRDIACLPIRERILSYTSPDGNRYCETEIKCALLVEWHLTGLGLVSWADLDITEKASRAKALISDCCAVLGIPEVRSEFIPQLTFKESLVDGLASWDGRISIREEVLLDFERTIEVILHELGHIVTYEIRKGGKKAESLKEQFGITDDRIHAWERGDMGVCVTVTEEDPDTLSYGVYTAWGAFFL